MLAAGASGSGARRRLDLDLRRRSRGGGPSTAAAAPSPPPPLPPTRAVAPGGDFLEDFDAIASLRRGKGGVGGVAATAAASAAASSSSSSPPAAARGKPAAAAAPASAEPTPSRSAAEEVLLFSLNGSGGEGEEQEEEFEGEDGIFVDDDEEALVVAAAMGSSFTVALEDKDEEGEKEEEKPAAEAAVAVASAEEEEEEEDASSADADADDDDELLPSSSSSSQPALGGAAAAAAALRAELRDCSSPEDVLDVAADEVGGGLSPACAAALLERLAALERKGPSSASSSPSSSSSCAACCERSPAFLALLDEVEAAADAGAMRPRDLAQSAWALGTLRALRGRSSAAARSLASSAASKKLLPLLSAQDLAALFHGLGRLRADPGRDALAALGRAAATAAAASAGDGGAGGHHHQMGAQSLSMVCWGLAELCHHSNRGSAAPPPGVVEALGAALAALASSCGDSSSSSSGAADEASPSSSSFSPALGPQALAVAASALARLRWQPSRLEAASIGKAIAAAAHPDAVAADDARAEAEREAYSGRGDSSSSSSSSSSPSRPATLPASRRTSFRPRELTSALFALTEWRCASPEALSSVAQRLSRGGEGPGEELPGPVDWSTAAWAFASLGGDMTEQGWQQAEKALKEAAPTLPVRELATALWGLALAERFGESSSNPSAFDVLLAAALEAAEERWPLDARAVAQIARAHASAAVLRGSGNAANLPPLPQRLSDAAERRAKTSAARSPLSLTHARVAALAKDCGLPVSGVRVPLGVGLPVVDVALELKDGSSGEAIRVAVQVHCPREAPRAPPPGTPGFDDSTPPPALLGRAASAARLLRALGWLPLVVRPQDVPSSAPRAAQAAALMDCVRKGVAAALATEIPSSSSSSYSNSSLTSLLPPREAEARAAALLAGSMGAMKLTAADFVSPPPSDRRRTAGGGGASGGGGHGSGRSGGGGRGRGNSGGGGGGRGGGRSSSFSSQRKAPSGGNNKFSPGGGWGEVS